MVLKYSFKLFLGQMYLWIHHNYSSKRFQQCEWQRKILQTINFKNWTVNLSHGSVVWGLTFCAEGSWGAGSNPGTATFLFFFWFLSMFFSFIVFFSPLACFRLLLLLPLLASRDFWDNVFLFSGSCPHKGVLFHFGFITNQRIYTVSNISFDLHFAKS